MSLPLLETAIKVFEKQQVHFIFPGNVYNYNPDKYPVVYENTPQNPVSIKGKVRQQMEERLKQKANTQFRVLIFRMGDYIGKYAPSSWTNRLIKVENRKITLTLPGNKNVEHCWAYLPDACETLCQVIEKKDQLNNFENIHFPGTNASFAQIQSALENSFQQPVKTNSFPWFIIQILQLFSPMMKAILEMRYLWNKKLLLESLRLQELDIQPASTPLGEIFSMN